MAACAVARSSGVMTVATDRDGAALDVAAGTTGTDFWDESVPNFLAHRIQLRRIAKRAAHTGRVHGDE